MKSNIHQKRGFVSSVKQYGDSYKKYVLALNFFETAHLDPQGNSLKLLP